MSCTLVVKLGGDALATPERIAREAERLARLAAEGPVVAVASARRGVTDRLLGLVDAVAGAVPARPAEAGGPLDARAEQDRVVASGEVVAAALLAFALTRRGVAAISLDAREAGVVATHHSGGARIRRIHPKRIAALLAEGILPVVTGFQGWHRGRVTTLARGGTDTSAIALAVALGGRRVRLVKDAEGLCTADPRLVPASRPIARAPHRFLSALTAAGAQVVQAEAAALAERHHVTLEFCALAGDDPTSIVGDDAASTDVRAVASTILPDGTVAITALAADPAEVVTAADGIRAALLEDGVTLLERQPAASGLRLLVPAAEHMAALGAVHRAWVETTAPETAGVRRAS